VVVDNPELKIITLSLPLVTYMIYYRKTWR